MEQSEQLEVMYQVESILKKKINAQNKPLYLIKWKGWKEKTWEPIEHLYNVPEMIYQFQQQEKRNRRINKEPSKVSNNNSTANQQERERMFKPRRLKKMSDPIFETPSSQHEQQEQHRSKQQTVQNTASDRVTGHPRIKITQEYLKMGNERQEMRMSKGNIYLNQIQRIVKIDRRNDKWMVLVKFIEDYQDSWEERDVIRMLYPYKLLIFYEELYRKKEQK